jgi:ketosteroid isomerase-like protein
MSEENVKAMRRLYEAFAQGDMDAFEQGCSRDTVWNEAESSLYAAGNPYRGFPAIRDQVFAPTLRDFENFTCHLERVLDAGDYVIATGRYRGRNRETGKLLSAQFCHILQVDQQGKLEAFQEYVDTLQEAEVAGRTAPRVAEELKIPHPAM